MRQLASRDSWPSLTIKIEMMPWHWRFHWYADDIEAFYYLDLGPVEIHWSANRPWFFEMVEMVEMVGEESDERHLRLVQ